MACRKTDHSYVYWVLVLGCKADPVKLYAGETLWLMHERWRKLEKDFFHARKQKFDLSKIPDIYDNIKYDALHNSHLGLTNVGPLHTLARALADIVIPQV